MLSEGGERSGTKDFTGSKRVSVELGKSKTKKKKLVKKQEIERERKLYRE